MKWEIGEKALDAFTRPRLRFCETSVEVKYRQGVQLL